MSLIQWALVAIATILIGHHGGSSPPPTGDTCTVGPLTAATSYANVGTAINSALDGAVVCLQRGEVWSAVSGVTISSTHPNANRVTVCASTGSQCDPTGGASQPRVTITGDSPAITFATGSAGFALRNLDLYTTAVTTSGGGAVSFGNAVAHVSFEGIVIDGFWSGFKNNAASDAQAGDDIEMGMCGGAGHWVEIRNGPPIACANPSGGTPGNACGDRWSTYGVWKNSKFRPYVHDFRNGGCFSSSPNINCHINTSHYHDLGNGSSAWNDNEHDNIVECGRFDTTAANGPGASLLKINRGYGWVIRDMLFTSSTASQATVDAIAFASHTAGGTEGVSGGGVAGAGAQIYRNHFVRIGGVYVGIAADVDIFNNLMEGIADNNFRGLVQTHYDEGASDDIQIQQIRTFNNTVYVTGDSNPSAGYPKLMGTNGSPVASGRTFCTTCAIFNNLAWLTDTVNANVIGSKNGCSEFGSGGANIKNNYLYTPGSANPARLYNTCGSASGNSTSFNTNPNLVNVGTGDFHPAASSGTVCGFGTTGEPATDYDQLARGDFDVGAFRCP